MKRFRLISSIFIALIAVIFIANVVYMVQLYRSIRDNVERDVINALVDTDIDDMWERADRHRRMVLSVAMAEGENPDSVLQSQQSTTISGVMNDHGQIETTTVSNSNVVESRQTASVERSRSFSNQMTAEMSQQMHAHMDGRIGFNLAITDSIFIARLADRKIYPDLAVIEIVDSTGRVLHGNIHVPKNSASYDVFDFCFNPDSGQYYRAYITSLTGHILSEMSGVIITVFLLMVVFAAAFAYLYHTVSRLRTIEEMKDDFTNNMTHELKTPIAIAYAANDALLHYDTTNNSEKKESYLNIALKQLNRLSELVENILAMSMERRKSMPLKIERIDLAKFTREIIELNRLRFGDRVTFELNSLRPDVAVEADRSHLANIFNNIIDNSIKYSDGNPCISIVLRQHSIRFVDNGIGIPAKCLPFIFNKFYRVPNGDRQDTRGYGIGLYYVKNMVERFGWTISVQSQTGEGTEFTIKF